MRNKNVRACKLHNGFACKALAKNTKSGVMWWLTGALTKTYETLGTQAGGGSNDLIVCAPAIKSEDTI